MPLHHDAVAKLQINSEIAAKLVWDFLHIINSKNKEEGTPLSALPNERTVEQFPFCVRLNFYYYIYIIIYI